MVTRSRYVIVMSMFVYVSHTVFLPVSLELAWEWFDCLWDQRLVLWGPSYFNRCYCRVDRTLALGLGFPCANRNGLIVYTWAFINAKNVESSIRNVGHYRTLIEFLEISAKRILAACQAVCMVTLHLNNNKMKGVRCEGVLLVAQSTTLAHEKSYCCIYGDGEHG